MGLTKAGLEFLVQQAVIPTVNFDNANAYIGVGNGTTEFDIEQTDLMGTETERSPMDIGYPIVTDSSIKFRAIFTNVQANFEWNEWGIFNAASGGVMLARLVEYNSTKLDNQEWVMEGTLTFINVP